METGSKTWNGRRLFDHDQSPHDQVWSVSCSRIGALVAVPLMARQAKSTTGGTVSSFYDLKTMTLDGKPATSRSTKAR